MAKIWKNFTRTNFSRYEVGRLIDSRLRSEFPAGLGKFQIICDIDKTYLETRFESFVDIVQIALESASSKQTVEGASDTLITCRWGNIYKPEKDRPRHGLHFVSSSPPQLRAVLEEKLMIDGLEWDSDTFKNQAYNILKGRMSFLKQHIAYKSSAILSVIASLPGQKEFIFIGDNAESDALIYLGICLYLEGFFDQSDYIRYLQYCGLDSQMLESVEALLPKNIQAKVSGIMIRRAPGYDRKVPHFLSKLVRAFDHFYEVGVLMYNVGVISEKELTALTLNFHNYYGLSREYLCSVLEAAQIDRNDTMSEVVSECFEKLKIPSDMKWPKDMSKDLSMFDFNSIKTLDKEEVFSFAKEWIGKTSKQESS